MTTLRAAWKRLVSWLRKPMGSDEEITSEYIIVKGRYE